jgi:hypothetical protein
MSADYGAWRAKHLPRAIDPAWHGLFQLFALADLTPERLESFVTYAETMYLETGNPLYPLRVWQACRRHRRPPPEWILHHFDDTASAAWQLLDRKRTPTGDEVASAFGFGPRVRRYAKISSPRDALIGYMVARLSCNGSENVEAAIRQVMDHWRISRAEVYRSWQYYLQLPGN